MRSQTSPSRTRHGLRAALHALSLGILLYLPAAASDAADDLTPPRFLFSGFGTFGLVHSGEDRADYTASPLQPSGAGYTHAWSPNVDSNLGAQLIAHITPRISAMLQVIAEQRYDNTYTPQVEWLNLSYQATPDFSVRVGKIVLPTFLISASRKVGYANPWVRPPTEIYALSPVFNSDGADASYKRQMGPLINTLVGSFGRTTFRTPGDGHFDVRRLFIIADTLEFGPLTTHVAYQASHYTYGAFDPLFSALGEFGPQGAALADKYDTDDKVARLLTVGALYDDDRWFVTGEWARRNLHSVFGESTAWYLSGGYRVEKFTPYLTVASVKADSRTFESGLNVSELPPYLAASAAALNAGVNAILAQTAAQRSISIGSRWDVWKSVDLKLQFDHIDVAPGSPGPLINLQPGFQRRPVNLVSIAVDFVW